MQLKKGDRVCLVLSCPLTKVKPNRRAHVERKGVSYTLPGQDNKRLFQPVPYVCAISERIKYNYIMIVPSR